MSIETDLSSIAKSLQSIAESIASLSGKQAALAIRDVPQEPQAPTEDPSRPRIPVPPVPPVPSAQVVPMPSPQPAPAPQAFPVSPLNTPDDVMQYCAHKYAALGPAKGAQMQAVLTALGHATLNTLKPEQYNEFYSKIEALA